MFGSRNKKQEGAGPPFTQLGDIGFGLEPALPSSSFGSNSIFGANLNDSTLPSLKEIVKKRLLDDMVRGFAGEAAGVVLLCDTFTLHVLSSCCKVSELLEENIHLIENITMKGPDGDYLRRQPLPALTAVYFLTPTVESVNRLIADYRDKKHPMYANCHLFFSSRLSDALLAKIKNSPVIGRVAGLKELYLELVCTEPNVFMLDSPQSLPLLFAPEEAPSSTEGKLQEHHRLASMIATLCTTLGEMPLIRHAVRPVAQSVAQILHRKLQELSRLPGSSFPTRHLPDHERPTLLILDRSSDPLSPLLHEFTYAAMCNDVLPVNNDRYRYTYVGNNNQAQTKEVLLNDTDPLWARFRNMHIADLGTTLHSEFKAFVAEHPEAAGLTKTGQQKDIKQITEGVRHLPKFKERSERYSMHMALGQELMSKYHNANLELVATLEQNMATGEDANGKAYKTALMDLKALLLRRDLALSPEDKMRLLMIYVITQEGLRQEERRELNRLAEISPEDQVAILNLFYLQVALLQGTSSRKRGASKRDRAAGEGYDVSRYVPPLKRHVEELLTTGLPAADFPFIESPSGAAASAGAGGRKGSSKASAEVASGRRTIVFVLGGLTHSELRSMQELARTTNREIIVGSTAMLTPQGFILALKDMKQLETPSLV